MTADVRTTPERGDSSPIALFFDEMSGTRNEVFRTHPILDYEQQVRSRVALQLLHTKDGDSVLDIGCGNARDIIPVLRAGATVVGVDLSQGMIDQARQDLVAAGYPDVRLEIGDATRLSFPAESFDSILCSEVIEHIPDTDQAIREMYRVLKPAGCLVITTPNRRSWYGFDRYVLWRGLFRRKWNHPFDNWRTMPELTSLLERHGFVPTSRQTTCYVPGFLLTYFLPRVLQSAVAQCVGVVESLVSRLVPWHGYLLVVTARRKG
jgi:ubiquinone/menaquinone biosynthesis C-methylase UbiE